jgi:hypothetical protein
MNIQFDKFEKWAMARFGEENVVVKGKEIRINSIFEPDDTAFHLWCSPSGGKKKRKFGVFHCFKTDKKGSLVKLVQLVDNCDREDALSTLAGRTSIHDLEKQLEAFFEKEDDLPEEPIKQTFTLPPCCELISNLGTNNWWRQKAEEYLTKRKIPIDGLYICTDDRYKFRIIIPYYDKYGKLIYWNGRHIGKSKCKYLGPPKEVGVGKEDVVYMAGKWPKEKEIVYLCEGEFNAKTLALAEFNAAACGGKNMSEKQALLLADYKIVLCLDRDKAGKAGTSKMSSMITSLETVKQGKDKLMYVIPPVGYNDWNEFLVKNNVELLHYYILKNQRCLDYSGPIGTIGDYFGFSDIWR